ncbi:hypothetical protein SERLA73DRAFT_187707, partial [Serpula lacrymans var. lacrymans S7.3]
QSRSECVQAGESRCRACRERGGDTARPWPALGVEQRKRKRKRSGLSRTEPRIKRRVSRKALVFTKWFHTKRLEAPPNLQPRVFHPIQFLTVSFAPPRTSALEDTTTTTTTKGRGRERCLSRGSHSLGSLSYLDRSHIPYARCSRYAFETCALTG